jgi:chromosome segregation ATPase
MGMFTEWRDDEIAKLQQQLQEARAENAALVAEFQRLADEPPTLEEIAADLDKIEMLEKQLAEAQAEIERLALEIENRQYTITCASEENLQLKESLAEARAEIERKDTLIEQLKKALESAKQRHYVNDDDNWYSCPASGLCSDDHAGTDCNCGADYVNSIIKAALSAAERGGE